MLKLVGLLGLMAFVAASLVVGVRILLLARKTRGLPETFMGLSLVLAGAFGTGLSVLPLLWTSLSDAASDALMASANITNHVGYLLLFVFVWRVFRPSEKWALALFLSCSAVLVLGGIGLAISLAPGETLTRPTGPAATWLSVSLLARLVGYTWAAAESFHYYGMLKRRLKLGLADPVMTSRFFYWGVCMTSVVGIWLNLIIVQLVPAFADQPAYSHLISAVLGFAVAGSLSVAFFPRAAAQETVGAAEPNQEGTSLG